MSFAKRLWALVQGDPVFMRRLNGWLTMNILSRGLSSDKTYAGRTPFDGSDESTLPLPYRQRAPPAALERQMRRGVNRHSLAA